MKLDPTVAVAELKELEELRKFKENHKDGWAYAEKMDKLRQEAEAKLREVFEVGHNDDCMFCGFKDKIARGQDDQPRL